MSRNPHVTSAKISSSEPQNLVKNFLIKNLFPKKEKKNYKSSQRASEAPGPGPGEANNAFSKIFIYKHHTHTIFLPSPLRIPSE